MIKYYELFNNLINELKSIENINVEFDFQKGISDYEIVRLEKLAKVTISENIKAFYRQLNGIKVNWYVTSADIDKHIHPNHPVNVTGIIRIVELERLLVGGNLQNPWKDLFWFDFDEDKNSKKNMRPFDIFNSDDKECMAFIEDNEKIVDNLNFYNLEYGLNKLKLSLEKYIKMTINFKGMLFWQRGYLLNISTYKNEVQFYLPQIFPDVDLSVIK